MPLRTFRCVAIAWAAVAYRSHRSMLVTAAERAAAGSKRETDDSERAAAYAVATLTADHGHQANCATLAVRYALNAAAAFGLDAFTVTLNALATDANLLDQGVDSVTLGFSQLWPTQPPVWATDEWESVRSSLLAANEAWDVWTSWYDARLAGDPTDQAHEIARATIDDDIWVEGPTAVNEHIIHMIENDTPQAAQIFSEVTRPAPQASGFSLAELQEPNHFEDFERWLASKPRPWSIVIATRAAHRVLPLALDFKSDDSSAVDRWAADVVLPLLRAAAFCRLAAGPLHTVAAAAMSEAIASARLTKARTLKRRAAAAALHAAASAVEVVFTEAPAKAARAVSSAIVAATKVLSARSAVAFNESFKKDVELLDTDHAPVQIAAMPLWYREEPEWAKYFSSEHVNSRLHVNGHLNVWRNWYDSLIKGQLLATASLAAYTNIPGPLPWDDGPEAVNLKIAERLAAPSVAERQLGASQDTPPESRPPAAPLPSPSPATRFVVIHDKVDIVPPAVDHDREVKIAAYYARARLLATRLAERLAKTDAAPEVAGSATALVDVLGDDSTQLQPDLLRLASRSIAAKARAYGHPSATYEISPDSVSGLFELADVLVDLQSFMKTEVEENERAIRQLDLKVDSAATAKEALDELTGAIQCSTEVVSERVETTFSAAASVSASAGDAQVKVAVEGERILLTENLALALARELGRQSATEASATTFSGEAAAESSETPAPEQPTKRQRRSGTSRARQSSSSKAFPEGDSPWDDFTKRLTARLREKAPEALADAGIQAATAVIKHSPKTIAGLAAAVVLLISSYPVLVAATGGLGLTSAWIGYELFKRSRSQPRVGNDRKEPDVGAGSSAPRRTSACRPKRGELA
jgi:hypothetical protein